MPKVVTLAQILSVDNQRLAPFRRKTVGYTGQKKNAMRPQFQFNKIELKMVGTCILTF